MWLVAGSVKGGLGTGMGALLQLLVLDFQLAILPD